MDPYCRWDCRLRGGQTVCHAPRKALDPVAVRPLFLLDEHQMETTGFPSDMNQMQTQRLHSGLPKV